MIRRMKVYQFAQIESLLCEFLKRISQDEDQIPQWKDKLRKDVEANERVLLAVFADDSMPSGFGILNPSNNEITAFHPLDDTWTELFTQVFDLARRDYSVIRIRSAAVPESKYGFMNEIGFSKIDYAYMSVQRSEIESLTLDHLPENLSIVRYDETIQKPVAEMMFESYLDSSWAHQFPEYHGSLDACQKAIEEWSKEYHTSILSIDGIIIGSCHIGTEGIRRPIGNVAIKPEYRKRGFGRILVTSVLLAAVKENPEIESIHLGTPPGHPAFYLYESLGFVTNSIQPLFAWSKKE
ncbi:MAG: GNAT family N-acetyltransferase [Candidatus Thorarchaeota archaeon]